MRFIIYLKISYKFFRCKHLISILYKKNGKIVLVYQFIISQKINLYIFFQFIIILMNVQLNILTRNVWLKCVQSLRASGGIWSQVCVCVAMCGFLLLPETFKVNFLLSANARNIIYHTSPPWNKQSANAKSNSRCEKMNERD